MRSIAPAIAVVLLLGGGAANAASSDGDDAAAHVARAESLYRAGQFKQALAEYGAAYGLTRDPVHFVGMGRCHRKLGEYDQAIYFLRGYLAFEPEAPDRADVERMVNEAEAARAAAEATAEAALPHHEPAKPVWKRGWFWGTVAGVVAVGAGATAAGLLLAPHAGDSPTDSLGSFDARTMAH